MPETDKGLLRRVLAFFRPSPPEPPRPHRSDLRGRLELALGPAYEVRSELGRGAFGIVFSVWDRPLGRRLAVKVLRPDVSLPGAIQRFQREAQTIGRLRHPNIVPLYFVGGGEGLAFMVMPQLEGETLRVSLQRHRQIPLAETVQVIADVADGLDTAHESGVIHRDIKPENILLEGPRRRAMIMDFGIAKLIDPTTFYLTTRATIIGTPCYMSPEQAVGSTTIDHRSDVYALGCVAFEMLSGQPPFDGETPQEILDKHNSHEPPTLSSLDPRLPAAVSVAVAKALAKVPDDRFATTGAFAVALRNANLEEAAAERPAIPAASKNPILRPVNLHHVAALDPRVAMIMQRAEREDARGVFRGMTTGGFSVTLGTTTGESPNVPLPAKARTMSRTPGPVAASWVAALTLLVMWTLGGGLWIGWASVVVALIGLGFTVRTFLATRQDASAVEQDETALRALVVSQSDLGAPKAPWRDGMDAAWVALGVGNWEALVAWIARAVVLGAGFAELKPLFRAMEQSGNDPTDLLTATGEQEATGLRLADVVQAYAEDRAEAGARAAADALYQNAIELRLRYLPEDHHSIQDLNQARDELNPPQG